MNPEKSDWYICFIGCGAKQPLLYNCNNKFWCDLGGKTYKPDVVNWFDHEANPPKWRHVAESTEPKVQPGLLLSPSSRYANGNFESCSYHRSDDKRTTDFDKLKSAFEAGANHKQEYTYSITDMKAALTEAYLCGQINTGIFDINAWIKNYDDSK